MVRAPCCEKMGLKRGPWTPEEDHVLISYIKRYGHGNWRALPKQAGLLRCGKSCRLRWTNYLRPDIKRGNFSREEEETIIRLHGLLGNRWSAIAARLPGRTDNEIKNVWHTHLKKRLNQISPSETHQEPLQISECKSNTEKESISKIPELESPAKNGGILENSSRILGSPQHSGSNISTSSSLTTESSSVPTCENRNSAIEDDDSSESAGGSWPENFETMDFFWPDNSPEAMTGILAEDPLEFHLPQLPPASSPWPYIDENMDFWFNVLMGDGQLPGMPEF